MLEHRYYQDQRLHSVDVSEVSCIRACAEYRWIKRGGQRKGSRCAVGRPEGESGRPIEAEQ